MFFCVTGKMILLSSVQATETTISASRAQKGQGLGKVTLHPLASPQQANQPHNLHHHVVICQRYINLWRPARVFNSFTRNTSICRQFRQKSTGFLMARFQEYFGVLCSRDQERLSGTNTLGKDDAEGDTNHKPWITDISHEGYTSSLFCNSTSTMQRRIQDRQNSIYQGQTVLRSLTLVNQ